MTATAVTMVRDAITEAVATRADVADLKADVLKAAIGIVFANAGLAFALLKLLP